MYLKGIVYRVVWSALIYYGAGVVLGELFVAPDSLIGFAGFLPPLLSLMYGPWTAVGVLLAALAFEYGDWFSLVDVYEKSGAQETLWQGFLLFCNCGWWAFMEGYLPYRLWHSVFVREGEPRFSLRADTMAKFVLVAFVANIATALFLAMTTNEADILRLMEGAPLGFGLIGEYAFICFINDFDIAIFFGLIIFFFLLSFDFNFYKPPSNSNFLGKLPPRLFDAVFVAGCAMSLYLCQERFLPCEGLRFGVGIVLCVYMFRPVLPMAETEKSYGNSAAFDTGINRMVAAVFYAFMLILFVALDTSGAIYDLSNMSTWHRFNGECLTMMNVVLAVLLYMLLRYRNSIMANVVLLEVVTVFVTAFALGAVGFAVVDRMTMKNVDTSLAEMSIIFREHLKRTFDGIQVSVNDIRDLALAELTSYEELARDKDYQNAYLRKAEQLFGAIAGNTEGSVAFYFRLNPEFAGPLGGFSWWREQNRWDGAAAKFNPRRPIDLSLYAPTDYENVGWYYIPVSRANGTWIEPYIDPLLNAYVISYVSPIYHDGKLVGVVGMDIDFEYLVQEVRRMSVYEYGYAYLKDRLGRVLYHKDYNQGDKFYPNPDFLERETYLTDGIWLGLATSKHDIYTERNNLSMHLVSVMLAVTLLVSFLSISLASRGIKPLIALTGATKKIAAGNLDVKLNYESKNELGTLVSSIKEMMAKLEVFVYHDQLTGLNNTAAYARKKQELENSDGTYAVMVFDVNFLKKINDTYGHDAGNDLIRAVAQIIARVFGRGQAYRIGGDEFAVIVNGDGCNNVPKLINEFDRRVAMAKLKVQGKEYPIHVARGISYRKDGQRYVDVFNDADEAMYVHKAAIKERLGVDSMR